MTTPPERVRAGLTVVTSAAAADVRAVAETADGPAATRAALFAAAPLIVSEYSSGTAALALDWYEELRDAAPNVKALFQPRPLVLVTDDIVAAVVASATVTMREDAEDATVEAVAAVEDETQRLVADAFRDTMIGNVAEDPAAVGWRRFARPEACKFCKMLAAKGAVYTKETARFAAHGAVMAGDRKGGNCMCIAGPEFGGQNDWAEATPMQYLASRRKRTEKERAALREYLTEHFPDAPG